MSLTKLRKLKNACNSIYRNNSSKAAWFVKQYIKKCEKSRDAQHVK